MTALKSDAEKPVEQKRKSSSLSSQVKDGQGLSKEDQAIAERLERLKESRRSGGHLWQFS